MLLKSPLEEHEHSTETHQEDLAMKASRRFGFTIVELLVVISVILILVGLLASGLSGAIRTGKTTKEMNRLKQIMLAWQMYSGQYGDKILPGFLEQDGPTGVQQGAIGSTAWQVRYRNKRGQELAPGLCQTYPWRLAPYLDFNYDPLLGYRSVAEDALDVSLYQDPEVPANLPASLLTTANPTLEGAGAALQPGFGYNAYYVGGWWAYTNNTPTLVFGNDGYTQVGASGVARGRLIATSQGNIAKPSELIVFSASTFLNQSSDPYSKFADDRAGAAWVVPHKLGQTDIWGFGGVVLETQTNASQRNWNDPILALLSPAPAPKFQGDIGKLLVYQNQAIPFARYGTQVSIGVADLSVRSTGITSLNDLRLWVPAADDLNFSHAP